MKEGISIRQAARNLGVSHVTILRWVKKGYIKTLPDGGLDPDTLEAQAAIAAKKQSSIHGGRRGKTGSSKNEAPRQLPDSTKISLEEARIMTEVNKARQQELDYMIAIKQVVTVASVERAFTDLGALTRAVLERLPDRLAFGLAQETDPHAVRIVLLDALNEAMLEIANTAKDQADILNCDQN